MSVEHSLDQIIDEDTSPDANHKVTRYRRRDLRNSLASRMGMGENSDRSLEERISPSKKRIKFTNIPLDVSDYTLDDMVKEFGIPIYSNFYDSKESRTAVFEFEDAHVLEKIVEKYNGSDLNGMSITVEIFDQSTGHDRRRKKRVDRRLGRGSHHGINKRKGKPRTTIKPTTVQDLDAELEAYMNS